MWLRNCTGTTNPNICSFALGYLVDSSPKKSLFLFALGESCTFPAFLFSVARDFSCCFSGHPSQMLGILLLCVVVVLNQVNNVPARLEMQDKSKGLVVILLKQIFRDVRRPIRALVERPTFGRKRNGLFCGGSILMEWPNGPAFPIYPSCR